jgi:hypothetical protein
MIDVRLLVERFYGRFSQFRWRAQPRDVDRVLQDFGFAMDHFRDGPSRSAQLI